MPFREQYLHLANVSFCLSTDEISDMGRYGFILIRPVMEMGDVSVFLRVRGFSAIAQIMLIADSVFL